MNIHEIISETVFIVKYLVPLGAMFVLGIRVTLWKIEQVEKEDE